MAAAHGWSVLPDIYMGTFKALQILLPPLVEQKKISDIGAAFDRRLEHERDTLTILIRIAPRSPRSFCPVAFVPRKHHRAPSRQAGESGMNGGH